MTATELCEDVTSFTCVESGCEHGPWPRGTTPFGTETIMNRWNTKSQCHFLLYRSLTDRAAKNPQHLPSAGAHLVMMTSGLRGGDEAHMFPQSEDVWDCLSTKYAFISIFMVKMSILKAVLVWNNET